MRAGFLGALRDRPLLLDGGMGTRLLARGLDLGSDDPSLWNLTHPEAVAAIHALDVAAGSDAILTNTFAANRACLGRFGRASDVPAINAAAVALARDAAGPDRFVLGSIGPMPEPSEAGYRDQAGALIEAGVDGLILETHRVREVATALGFLRPVSSLPIVAGIWVRPGRDELRWLGELGLDVAGMNCVRPVQICRWLESMSEGVEIPLLAMPSASDGTDKAPIQPAEFAREVPGWLGSGVRLFGGCCGSTEAHVRALRTALDSAQANGV